MVGINDQKINDLDGIPLPDNFMVNRQSDIATPFLEKELLGDVQIIYNVAPEHKFFYAFLYKSPQQLMDNLNKTADEIDIVWTFGVILYGMLSNNEHPFEGLKEQILDQNDSYRNNKILQLSLHYKIYVDNHGQIWGKGQTLRKNLQKKIEFFLKNGDELPIPYDNVMPTDLLCDNDDADDQYVCINEYEPLINLTKQCLQTYKDKRILMSDLRKQLEEITCEK
ncbi:hypothetical protein GPALN_010141 [Globodera pallida]|nr:hypothetical protein GPALN_010141 [Globodera pallida]